MAASSNITFWMYRYWSSPADVMPHYAQRHVYVQVGITGANRCRIVGVTGPQRQLGDWRQFKAELDDVNVLYAEACPVVRAKLISYFNNLVQGLLTAAMELNQMVWSAIKVRPGRKSMATLGAGSWRESNAARSANSPRYLSKSSI